MSNQMIGANLQDMERLAEALGSVANSLDPIRAELNHRLGSAPWTGPDADRFRSDWSRQHNPALLAAAAALRDAEAVVRRNRAEQDQASSTNGSLQIGGVAFAALAGFLAGAAGFGSAGLAPPVGGTPSQNASWWNALTSAQQQALLRDHPEMIGNLDGMPGSIRDEANRNRIPIERANLEAEKARLEATGDGDGAKRVQAKLNSLSAIETALKPKEGQPPFPPGERQLLVLDVNGERVKAAVSVGNVDTARNVAVFTPGLGTTVDKNLVGYVDDMARLRETSEGLSGGQTTATVAWIGYEAPQNVIEVASRSQADVGGRTLAGFLDGISSSRLDNDAVHLTLVGHSYGSTTAGCALQDLAHMHRGVVDDAVFYGSPGLGTSNVQDLGLPDGHAFLLEARGDRVADMGAFGADPGWLPGIRHLSTNADHGMDQSTGHSDYLKQKTTSEYNIAAVVSGNPDMAVPVHGLDDFDEGDVAEAVGPLRPVGPGLLYGFDKLSEFVTDTAEDVGRAVTDTADKVADGAKHAAHDTVQAVTYTIDQLNPFHKK